METRPVDTLDESSEPATCAHTLSRLPDPAPLRVVSYLHRSSSHPGFPALRPQASGLRLAQQAHTDIPSRTSPGSCLPDTCIWTQRSLLSAALWRLLLPPHLLRLYFPVSAHGHTARPAGSPGVSGAPVPPPHSSPMSRPGWLCFKSNRAPLWLRGKQSAFQCRRHRLHPWSGKTPQPRGF